MTILPLLFSTGEEGSPGWALLQWINRSIEMTITNQDGGYCFLQGLLLGVTEPDYAKSLTKGLASSNLIPDYTALMNTWAVTKEELGRDSQFGG